MIVFRFAQGGIGSQVIAPQAEACGVNIVARCHGVGGCASLVGFAISESRYPGIPPVRGKVKDKHVVLMILQRRNQGQQFAAARSVAVAENDRRRAAQSREKPAMARAQPRNGKIHKVRLTGKAFHVDFTAGTLGLDDPVDEEASDGAGREHCKKHQSQERRKEFRIQLGWIAEFVEDRHS